ncbi:MAG TPA: fibronectin type III domain-containing protein [Bryobacteraceae bacterium]|nr:fibronectin type III domain-containing protein [Bryobacteraceae bacterium]
MSVLATLPALVYAQGVPAPPAPPPVPAGSYCASIYAELNGDLQAFNTVLATPPTWTPAPGGPTLYGANLQWADSNTGPSISGPSYMQTTVQPQLQAMKALGIQAVSVPVLFPVLYEPFYGSQAALQPYLNFYTQVAQAVRAAGLKLIIDDEILFSNDIAAGWSNMNAFYSTLTWPEYIAARAQMAATIAQTMQPDYLMLANEPDTEALQTGQQNLNTPADAAQMVAAEIAAVQALNMSPAPQLGAGFGTWMAATGTASLTNYINAYITLPLNYIDYHLLPINTVQENNFLDNALTITQMAAAAGLPVAISQAFATKEAAGEWDILSSDVIRSRGAFSFWAPLDNYFMQTAQALASYTNMIYLVPEMPVFMFAQQTYGGTASNGGAANCTCTTESCSDYDIMNTENSLAAAADQQSVYAPTAFSYYSQLVTNSDLTPPSPPPTLTGTAGTTGAGLTWGASTDDVGVAGYNVYRCTPPAAGQPCTGVWIADTTLPSFDDSTLASNTLYNYQVQAFDFANNSSPLSPTLSLQTYRTVADAASNLVATTASAQEIDLSWSPPSNTTGLSQYQVYSGTSPSSLQQIAIRSASQPTYRSITLAPGTTYYYGIVAVEEGIAAAMSPVTSAATLPLPNPPSNVAATPNPTTVALSWQETLQPNGLPISYYEIFEGTTPGQLTKVAQSTSASYTMRSLSANTTYYFEIAAMDTGHDASAPSNQIAVNTLATPTAPVNVAAAPNATTRVTVTWSENIPSNGLPIGSYTVFRGTSPTGLTKLSQTTAQKSVDATVAANTTYYYAVEATDTGQDVSPMSATIQVATPPVPAAPVIAAATATSGSQVSVSWSENVPPNGLPIGSYNIYRGTSPTGLTKLATRTGLSFIDTGASPNTTYYYAIQAVDTGGDDSLMSATAQVTTPPVPAAPVNVAATSNSGGTQVTVSWSENIPPNGLPVSSYSIFRGTSPNGLTQLTARTGLSFIDTAVSPGVTYYYAIEAVDSGHDVSPMSSASQVTTP